MGTASWTDPGFVADWYPEKLPARKRLAWYAEHFDLVEVNSTFYSVPSEDAVERWCEQTPSHFLFDVKLHRLLSRHSTKSDLLPRGLRTLAQTDARGKIMLTPKLEKALTKVFLEALSPLEQCSKLGALLLQLSPSFRPRTNSLDELDSLLETLRGYRVAVELRNRDWAEGEQLEKTEGYFRKRRLAFVTVDAPERNHFMIMPNIDVVTTPKLAYLRAHGRNAHGYVSGRSVPERFDHRYQEKELEEIAARAEHLAALASETHVIFNNNKSSYAPEAAARFREIVAEQKAAPSKSATQ